MYSLNRRSMLQSLLGAASLTGLTFGDATEIQTPLGKLQGFEKGQAKVFLGIPFAQAPIGNLRFRPPLPAKPWAGVLKAVSPTPAPIQAGSPDTSEDCLYLNVFAPLKSGPHPVFVWIYGGGNTAGSANNPQFDGGNFARDGVVCVVLTYRVGALGFLELGNVIGADYKGSGNNAIKDQVEALRWVQRNIAAFGGDPQNVTVGGQSAGAKNVAALMAAPDAKGLFHRAIIESGSAQTVHSLTNAEAVTALLLKTAELNAEKLLTSSAAELLQAQQKLLSAYPANYPFRPVVDGSFLPEIPLKEIATNSNVDLLIGTNRDEMVAFVNPAHAAMPIEQKEMGNAALNDITPVEAAYQAAFPKIDTADLHIRLLTAEEYWIPCVRIAEARNRLKANTYMYRFDHHPSSGNFADKSAHGSESAFVWDHAKPQTQALADEIHTAWVRFIREGKPVAAGLPDWPAYRSNRRLTMILDDQSHVEADPNRVERQIWNNRL